MLKARPFFLCLCVSNALPFVNCGLTTSDWMKDNIAKLGFRTLKELCVLGTHNSGMNSLNGGTAFARSCNTLNQSKGLLKQLQLGVRYFDVRPVISAGRFLTGHYTKVLNHWLGGNGQSIHSIVADINSFTRYHNELIIIRLSHSLNTDVGNKRYRGFIKEEWDRLFRVLDETKFMINASVYTSFSQITLNDLTNNGTRPAVIYIVESQFTGVFLGKRVGYGYFYPSSLSPFNKYSQSDKLSTMFQDQMEKMVSVSPRRYFLLSWTLTQSTIDASTCPIGRSIRQLAEEANSNLSKILSEVSNHAYPNIISVDFVESSALAEIVMAINNKLNL